MTSKHLAHSRYLTKARAAYAARLVAVGAMIAVPTACGSSDEDAFDGTTASVVQVTNPATTAAAATSATEPAPTEPAPATDAVATAPTSATDAPAPQDGGSVAVPAGSQLALEFTYTASTEGGRVHNPYIAAWVEDTEGNLVQTLAVWYQSGKGDKWLPDLSSWYSASTGTDVTMSGATRTPGSYSLSWDGLDWSGNTAPAGTYVVFVESAREKGPYSITSAEITLDGQPVSVSIPDNGELNTLTMSI